MTLGNGLKDIGIGAFQFCSSLTEVTIPPGVTNICDAAFNDCSTLASVKFTGNAPHVGMYAFSNVDPNCVVYIPDGASGYTVGADGKWHGMTVKYYTQSSTSTPAVSPGSDSGRQSYNGTIGGAVANASFSKAQTVNGALYDKNDRLVGTVQVKFGKINARKGTVRLSASATLLTGGRTKKITAKATSLTIGESGRAKLLFKAPLGEMTFAMAADGTFSLNNGSYVMARAAIGGALKSGQQGTFYLENFDLAVSGELQQELLPYAEPFTVVNGKWRFSNPNNSSLKLTYTAKTGVFKGNFKVFALTEKNGRTKQVKYTVNVIGLVVDGTGHGEASCKRPAGGPWIVTVE